MILLLLTVLSMGELCLAGLWCVAVSGAVLEGMCQK